MSETILDAMKRVRQRGKWLTTKMIWAIPGSKRKSNNFSALNFWADRCKSQPEQDSCILPKVLVLSHSFPLLWWSQLNLLSLWMHLFYLRQEVSICWAEHLWCWSVSDSEHREKEQILGSMEPGQLGISLTRYSPGTVFTRLKCAYLSNR